MQMMSKCEESNERSWDLIMAIYASCLNDLV